MVQNRPVAHSISTLEEIKTAYGRVTVISIAETFDF